MRKPALLVLLFLPGALALAGPSELVAKGAKITVLDTERKFCEGPAVAPNGDVYFTDIPRGQILRWSVSTKTLTVFMEKSGGANGLFFDKSGRLLACQGVAKQLGAIDLKTRKVSSLVKSYQGKRFNKPNDLWIDPRGGVYFSDPAYGLKSLSQDGEHVYYLAPGKTEAVRVISDYKRPNGLIGSADGKTLYVTDRARRQTWRYAIGADGRLSKKHLFCKEGSDGMTLDEHGNLYITPPAKALYVYNPAGERIKEIGLPDLPTNVVFGGAERRTLFVTARKHFLSLKMAVRGQP